MFALQHCFILLCLISNGFGLKPFDSITMKILSLLNMFTQENMGKLSVAYWENAVNFTQENLEKQLSVELNVSNTEKELWSWVTLFNWTALNNPTVQRQFSKYSILGVPILSEQKREKIYSLVNQMEEIYVNAKICSYQSSPSDCNEIHLNPDITDIFTYSRNPEELLYTWIKWRDTIGPQCRSLYTDYVELMNEASKLNKFQDTTDEWLAKYQSSTFQKDIEDLLEEIQPFYREIHAYVRYKLRTYYGPHLVPDNGPIPAHLLGNLWAHNWDHIIDIVKPFPFVTEDNLTAALRKQNYSVKRIFKTAENFFTSLDFPKMTADFWRKSIFQLQPDRPNMNCHPSAWDFYNGQDFRIKMCTSIDFESFKTAHHEMGHIVYFMAYKHLPIVFRDGANPDFHEAIGDLIGLSVQSRKHLQKLGLISNETADEPHTINHLLRVALEKVVFLPYAYLLDRWRWDVFSNKIPSDQYNSKWWELRLKYQGIQSPVHRNESDFDPAAKFHVVTSSPYIKYFISFVIQFQFHMKLCELAGEYNASDPMRPLHDCDLYGSTIAGNALKQMLQLGSSKPWQDVLESLSGERKMSAKGLMEYFKPLHQWLIKENHKNNIPIGWEDDEDNSGIVWSVLNGTKQFLQNLLLIGNLLIT